ncbi:MAG: hypothetical protein JWO06_2004 [Bacteroidota bacterium]|nr:hypothetical protein [Bacteroidota bacterium]
MQKIQIGSLPQPTCLPRKTGHINHTNHKNLPDGRQVTVQVLHLIPQSHNPKNPNSDSLDALGYAKGYESPGSLPTRPLGRGFVNHRSGLIAIGSFSANHNIARKNSGYLTFKRGRIRCLKK